MKVEEIKSRYPDPKPVCGSPHESYCVGGAVVMSVEEIEDAERRWPDVGRLAEALIQINPNLDQRITGSMTIASVFARTITLANDDDRTDLAWKAVEMAIDFDPNSQHLIDHAEKPAIPGSLHSMHRGGIVRLEGIIPPHKPSSIGRVVISKDDETTEEYFPGVIGAEWINREDQS